MAAANPCRSEFKLERVLPSMEMGPLDLAPLMRACSERVSLGGVMTERIDPRPGAGSMQIRDVIDFRVNISFWIW